MLERESRIRDIGYGAMIYRDDGRINGDDRGLRDSAGRYFAINTKGTPTEVVAKVSAAGFPVTEPQWADLARNLGEQTCLMRAGVHRICRRHGAHVCTRFGWSDGAGAVYHFAIMFERCLS